VTTDLDPGSLDALVAAPQHHRLVLENDTVRVLDTRIGPGETAPLHTHCWPSVLYVVATDHVVRRDADGSVLLDSRADDGEPAPVGSAIWTGPMSPHTVENVGESEIRLLNVEFKRA
jgi:hypothetical protein